MRLWTTSLAVTLAAAAAFGGDDGAKPKKPPAEPATNEKEDDDLPTQDLRAGGDEMKRYFVHGPKKGAKEPKGGWRLFYVLPGGDGGAGFQGFVKNMRRQALSDEYIEIQLVAAKWDEQQQIVWPTKRLPHAGAKFTTEDFFAAVHADVTKAYKVNPKYVFALGWSSGGPPVYALALEEKSPITGAYAAMSVFKPKDLPALSGAKGKPFFIDHSPEDKTCPFRMAEEARDSLAKAGAVVEFVTYEGGHGWKGALWDRMKKGIAHLEKHAPK